MKLVLKTLWIACALIGLTLPLATGCEGTSDAAIVAEGVKGQSSKSEGEDCPPTDDCPCSKARRAKADSK